VSRPRYKFWTALRQSSEGSEASRDTIKSAPVEAKRGITRGQVIFLTLGGSVFPFLLFQIVERLPGQDAISAGRWTVATITVVTILWVLTYLVRVGTKNTTYAQQLRAYEDAVLQKRLAELSDEELEALLTEEDEKSAASQRDP
jgi:hypothetical protein